MFDLQALCDNCATTFPIPRRTPLDMIITCPTCFFVSECIEFLSAHNELREVEVEVMAGG